MLTLCIFLKFLTYLHFVIRLLLEGHRFLSLSTVRCFLPSLNKVLIIIIMIMWKRAGECMVKGHVVCARRRVFVFIWCLTGGVFLSKSPEVKVKSSLNPNAQEFRPVKRSTPSPVSKVQCEQIL